ncbi:MAG: hypothetical protein JO053_03640 [Acidobacteria bacterium]|nr:hypothetical protein [Acidobacteriota bacterium]
MFSSTTNDFSKNESCPSSYELMEYQNGTFSAAEERRILRHLSACEFCSAETEFYSCFGEDEMDAEVSEPSMIPAPLFELAEALLKKRHTDSDSLNSLLQQKGKMLADPA